jgi:uncharacterized SAM-binding protein YcdF (DUF218 family)
MISDREQFLACLFSGPLLKSDAVVVLCGQDGIERAKVGVQLFRQQEPPPFLVLSGGVDNEKCEGAKTCHPFVMGQGVSPSRIILETESTNTREQAVNVVGMAIERSWRRLLLVASPYHVPRVFLTFLKALQEVDKDEEVQLVAVPASHLPWWKSPKGEKRTRLELLSGEAGKIAMYPQHIASYSKGLDHLRLWEGR